jgi:hypothetical protein
MRDGSEVECVRGSVWCRMLCLAVSLGDDGVLYSSPSVCLTLLVLCVGLVGEDRKPPFPLLSVTVLFLLEDLRGASLGAVRFGSACVVLSVSAE